MLAELRESQETVSEPNGRMMVFRCSSRFSSSRRDLPARTSSRVFHLGHDTETVDDMEGRTEYFLRAASKYAFMSKQTKTIFGTSFSPMSVKKPLKGFDGSAFAHPDRRARPAPTAAERGCSFDGAGQSQVGGLPLEYCCCRRKLGMQETKSGVYLRIKFSAKDESEWNVETPI